MINHNNQSERRHTIHSLSQSSSQRGTMLPILPLVLGGLQRPVAW